MSASLPRSRAEADWARRPERGNLAALRLFTALALWLGRPVVRALLHPITLYFVLFSPDGRRHSKRYLARALGRTPRFADGYRHVHAFAAATLDRVYLLRGRMDLFDIRVHGAEVMEQALAEGRGAFLVGAHFGSFEVLRAVGQAQVGMRVAMVMYPDNARMINAALQAVAPGQAPHVIALGRMESMLAVRDWLDDGGLAGMLADRQLGSDVERDALVPVDFLGREALFNDGPFRLAALLRRRVLFMAGPYLGGKRYDVHFELLADFSGRLPADERERRIREAVQAYAARLEALCRAHPWNWFNFHDFWHEDAGDAA